MSRNLLIAPKYVTSRSELLREDRKDLDSRATERKSLLNHEKNCYRRLLLCEV